LSLAVLRFGQGVLVLVVLLLLAGMRELLHVKWHDLPLLMLLGPVLFTVFPVTFNASLPLIEASRGALGFGHYTTVERIAGSDGPERTFGASAGRWGFSLVGGVGLALADRGLGWQGGLGTLVGDELMLATALCGAAYGVLAQRAFAR
jgi:hypothetical protein